jgi:hypothetical protein
MNQKNVFQLLKKDSSVNMSEWWFWNNQKEEEHFFEDVNSMY